jgi:hypothetical protein
VLNKVFFSIRKPLILNLSRTSRDTVHDKPISDFLLDDKEIFKNAVEQMRIDDTRSCRVRFSVVMGSKSTWPGEETTAGQEEAFPMEEVQEEVPHVLHLEGQGIIIQDKQDGEPSHVSSLCVSVYCICKTDIDYQDDVGP